MTQVQRTVREFRAMTKRVSVSTTIALWVCLSMTIIMFCVSLALPPRGAIDPSVFKAAGFMFAFASLFELREAIREGLGVKLTHGHTTIEVHDIDGPDGHGHGPHPGPEDYEPENEPEYEN